jgi:hypothetical protein
MMKKHRFANAQIFNYLPYFNYLDTSFTKVTHLPGGIIVSNTWDKIAFLETFNSELFFEIRKKDYDEET